MRQKTLVRFITPKIKAVGLAVLLASCAAVVDPENIEATGVGDGYQAQYRDVVTRRDDTFLTSQSMNAEKCLPLRGGVGGKSIGARVLLGEKVSRNDLVDVRIADDESLSGRYVISRDGSLKLPFIDAIPAQGRSVTDVESMLAGALINAELYENLPPISVRVVDFASVSIGVSGSVFEPHQIELGGTRGDQIDPNRAQALGASTEARNLSAALRAAGGVRPDADISAVELRRGGRLYKLDLRGVFEGRNMVDVMLLTGDQVHVPSRQCFQDDLMRPSPISPPGVTMFLSNLTQPATGNAPSAIGRDVREMPYGTRYMQAVVDANCVGGARVSSAHRSAMLMSRNPETKVSVVIERDIEDMLRRADRDDYDPFLLPGDAVACYDSAITNFAEAARILGAVTIGASLN
ncbi:MAG: polysaccharide biosynthesis/export family protein [Cognatishimia sp.]|uniref:polysaccharide biosynthesis/export family protein n=1 Tax=Cognatishimia sp. TaxID=2211648 RepID=UPI003B8CCDC6